MSKDKSTLINLVSLIPEEDQVTMGTQIVTDYDNDKESLQPWRGFRDTWYKLWACIRAEKNDPWPGASNVCIPLMSTASNQFHARAYQAIFNPKEIMQAIPVSENDFKRAKNVEDFMNWQLLFEMEEYEDVFDRLLQLLPVNGIGFKKVFWDPILDRVRTEYISATDLILPYRTRNLETARRINHRLWLHFEELEMRNSRGLYENFDKIAKLATEQTDEALKDTADKTSGENGVKSEDKPHLILECHKNLDLKVEDHEGVKPYVFTVDHATKTLLRVTSREFKRGKETITLNYFVDYHFIPNPEGFYSFGFGHFLEQLNEMANTAFNQIFDSGRLSNQPFMFYTRAAGVKQRKIRLHPGAATEVRDVSGILFPQMQRVDSVLFNILGLVSQYTESFTSVTDNLLGREQRGIERPTKGGTEAKIEQGLMIFNVMFKRIYRSLRKELRYIKLLNEIHLPDTKEFRIMGSRDKIAFPDIKKEDFKGVWDVIPIGDPVFASRTQRLQEVLFAYEVLIKNPFIGGVPAEEGQQTQFPPNVPALHELTSMLIDNLPHIVKNKRKLLPDLPEQPEFPEFENSMFAQGDSKSPVFGENHMQHLQIHEFFAQSEEFGKMPKKYKDLLNEHVRQTGILVQVEARIQQQQQSAPGGEIPNA